MSSMVIGLFARLTLASIFCAVLVVGLLTEARPQASQLTSEITSATTVSISPTSLVFSTQAIGTASTGKIVTLKNTGTMILTINNIAILGTNRGDFFISATSCGASLAVSAGCTIKVKFKPTSVGKRRAVLSFTDDASGSPLESPSAWRIFYDGKTGSIKQTA